MPNQPPVPAVRHHHIQQREQTPQQTTQQLQQQQIHQYLQAQDEPDEISMNIKKFNHQTQPDRAASTDMQLLDPTPPQRAIRAASAAPAIGQMASSAQEQTPIKVTPPPRQHKNMKNASSVSAVDVIQASSSSPTSPSSTLAAMNSTRITSSSSHDDSLNHHFSAMNLSSTSSSMYNTTLDNTIQSSSTANSSSKEKRKKRWNFLGRSKTPDKQKSATLGREKAANTTKLQKIKLAQDDLNLHHRWSTGVPKLQPISGQFSKDKLVGLKI